MKRNTGVLGGVAKVNERNLGYFVVSIAVFDAHEHSICITYVRWIQKFNSVLENSVHTFQGYLKS